MNRLGCIKLYKEYENVNFYVLHFNDKEHDEFTDFLLRFKDDSKYRKDFEILIAWLISISKTYAYERKFRPEKGASAVPIPSCKLRLYCHRVSDEILILCNGGVKTEGKAQDCPNVGPIFNDANLLAKEIKLRKTRRKIIIDGKFLRGDLEINIDN